MRFSVVACLLSALAAGAIPAAAREVDDESWVRSLEAADATAPLDGERFVRFLAGVRDGLAGGRDGAERLQAWVDPDTERSIVDALDGLFRRFDAGRARLARALAPLGEDPESAVLRFEALRAAERACWHLGRYRRVAEAYGAPPAEQAAAVPAFDACWRLQRAGYSAPVEASFATALAEDAARDAELAELREELAELERLFEDLRRIDEESP